MVIYRNAEGVHGQRKKLGTPAQTGGEKDFLVFLV